MEAELRGERSVNAFWVRSTMRGLWELGVEPRPSLLSWNFRGNWGMEVWEKLATKNDSTYYQRENESFFRQGFGQSCYVPRVLAVLMG